MPLLYIRIRCDAFIIVASSIQTPKSLDLYGETHIITSFINAKWMDFICRILKSSFEAMVGSVNRKEKPYYIPRDIQIELLSDITSSWSCLMSATVATDFVACWHTIRLKGF
jgi:hypothetical protein